MSAHYFMFSSGDYSDYGVALTAMWERLGDALHDEPNWTNYKNWQSQNDPETTFRKLHQMRKLDVLELWRGA